MAVELIAPTTGTAQSTPFVVAPNDTVTVSVKGTLGAADSMKITYTPDGDISWYQLKENAVFRALDNDNNIQLIRGPIRCRIDKGTTTATVGCALHTKANP